ncbi:serine acetyltransferase [Anoxybacter fermentans]|uniref:Serine acetyltransferase n=1 Tax=Anoxybacter fermentans TaxID=1323375 RepID=A0A3S9T007_9FIRM|nr:acetyltransferase [Anoxybacter fermentans]AZR73884.1 serine acetyltransferase [Anoxybacter fermentans]
MEKVIFIGAGDHCKNILSFFRFNKNFNIYGITDPNSKVDQIFNIPILGSDELLESLYKEKKVKYAFVTVGGTGDNKLRAILFEKAKKIGFDFINIYHPNSIVSQDLKVGVGNLFMAGSIINSNVSIGDNNIINTGAIIEHDVRIGNHTHIAPGVTLGGGVEVGDLSHIGIGATVIQGVKIGTNSIVGAGAVVLKDVADNSVVVGVPAKLLKLKD